ncbi:hypothetical protein LWP59_00420 [Amycolatopsis acidiphila]|uniref:Flagellar basal body-associated protein FliL n=1 Tax=Amycolatopsis acidiphila TaxID=715473 RepID=A0A558AFS1_9PSEU|nr:hypothetical protein [Amycolatopsis acidiphila]TVT23111.1 hypothetical protein FNH06_10815 [Amycolatopsis acidiphila]UIJ60204.1 hypothetical protein LWP59_00420 [Amycolatopsis acidiphila]GHG60795.1 hypothetical protein GCM10017788_14800 [Amycolatopsis acidiphila]
MSWQDELRRLDAKLATGEVSLHQHRKQREELLAAASGGFAPSPVASPLVPAQPLETAPAWPTAPPPEVPAPAAAPSWSASLLSTDRPTSAPSPADERPTDSIRYPTIHDAPTVITRAIGPATLPGLAPAPPPRDQVPALPTRPVRPARRRPTWLFLALGVFLVLAMIVGATWFLGARGGTSSGATNGSAPALSPADAAERAEAKLPTLPGAANPDNSTMPVDKALELKLVTQADADLMRAAGAQEVIYRAASDPANSPNGTMVLVVPASSATQAAALADGLRKNLADTGFAPMALGPANADLMYTGSNPQGRVGALWYSSGSLAVGMGVSQPLTGDPGLLRTRLEQIRTQVTDAFPAS